MANSIFGDLILTSYGRIVDLADGTPFPERVEAKVLPNGSPPVIEFAFEVRDGRPVLMRFSVVGVDEPVTPSAIHDLPVAKMASEAVKRIAIVVAVGGSQAVTET